MKFKITDEQKNTTRTIETPLTFKQWLSIHFAAWGFYQITQIDKKTFYITDKFTGELLHTIKK